MPTSLSVRCLPLSVFVLALAFAGGAHGQSPAPQNGATNGASNGASNAANAISEAVQSGASPYRPTPDSTPEEERRARCEALEKEYNTASKQRTYKSGGAATQTAQGRTIPKIERDKSLKSLKETYRANCT